jgi:hypothetical protein
MTQSTPQRVVQRGRVFPEISREDFCLNQDIQDLRIYSPHSADVNQIINIFEKFQPEKFYLPNFSD